MCGGGAYKITSPSMAFFKTTAAELPESENLLNMAFKGFFGD
jgi:hypothetical protein